MANLKNKLIKSLQANSDFDTALQDIPQVQQNLLKNYSNPVFNSKDKNKILN